MTSSARCAPILLDLEAVEAKHPRILCSPGTFQLMDVMCANGKSINYPTYRKVNVLILLKRNVLYKYTYIINNKK